MLSVWVITLLVISLILFYHRASLKVWAVSLAIYLLFLTQLSAASHYSLIVMWGSFVIGISILSVPYLRQRLLTGHVLRFYRRVMPTMSRTEKEALGAGTVGWEGELFSGAPNWHTFLTYPKPRLTEEERAFIDGPVDTLCSMIDDWDITHRRADLPPDIWDYLKSEGFFSLIIPKEYGGKAFSAYAHSEILIKIYGKSASVATTVSVPNSLGPAELLLHYGTQEQKDYYLPRLAKGIDIPCFALTSPDAGSDAGAMQDKGIVCKKLFEGKQTLGISLNWNKRYITLAPVATVIGLAFKLYDPDHLLGEQEELGITCALIPRETTGITIGRRHFPVNIAFQNGPIQGQDVFIPLDWIIGGEKMVGQGWRMLMECLAAGRAISLPASSLGGVKALARNSGAYARVRQQFNVPIGSFEGIKEALAKIGGNAYVMDATRSLTSAIIDLGEKPAVASAITKYHVTELGREVANDAMDLHGGKGVCLGPNNYVGRFYESVPIAITVEGANILTRNMIIFGQGAMRCHPYIFEEFEAAQLEDPTSRLIAFDKAYTAHVGYTLSNFVRSFILGLTQGAFVQVPSGKTKRFFKRVTRFSAAYALTADFSLLMLGGSLKRRESLSARLGDILSYLYIISAVLKHYHNQGKHAEDLPLIRWACLTYFYRIEQSFDEFISNFPNRFARVLLRLFVFPLGRFASKPSDRLSHKVAQLLMEPNAARDRLTQGCYMSPVAGNANALMEEALQKVILAEPVEKLLKLAIKNKKINKGEPLISQAKQAFANQIINKEQLDILLQADHIRKLVIAVDDFDPSELGQYSNIENKSSSHSSLDSIG